MSCTEVTAEIKEKAYTTLERGNGIPTKEHLQERIENSQRIYDCLYSTFTQRQKALEDILVMQTMIEIVYGKTLIDGR